jgi:Putative Actinobacterial Holin-X, holin superfamily III
MSTDDLRFRNTGNGEDYRSTPGLFADLFGQTTRLVSSEFALARAEASEKIAQAVTGFALIVGGAVFLIGALNVLLAAAVTALVEAGIAAPWSSLIVAAAVGILGGLLLWAGLGNLKTSRLAPRRTAEQVRRDAHLVKERMQ